MPSLVNRYNEPHRHYHTLQHIQEMHALLQKMIQDNDIDLDFESFEALRLSIWYHDAVYAPGKDDNEERSIDVTKEELTGRIHPELLSDVCRLIHSTAEHIPSSEDEKILSDLDLAILGSIPDRYTQYVDQVRKEFDFVPDDRWKLGRGALLQGFLDRPVIFYYLTRLEAPARRNLEWELAQLTEKG